jgi:hypothetical protein
MSLFGSRSRAGKNRRRQGRRPSRARFAPRVDSLEGRTLLSNLIVTNNLDSGDGSLRAEVQLAQTGDMITFSPDLVGQTIALMSGPITISTGVDIEGPGASSLTVSGSGALFRVFPPVPAAGVTIAGLTISGGTGSINNFASLTLRDDVFSGNHGALQNNNKSTATVIDSVFSDNHVGSPTAGLSFGGAIFNTGTLTISGSQFTNNSATGRTALGGAINSSFSSVLTITGTTFDSNSVVGSSTQGGAINLDSGATLSISGSSFTNNTDSSSGSGALGGAISASGLKRSTIDTTFFANNQAVGTTANAAGFGGAIEVSGSPLTITASLFTGNQAVGGSNSFGTGGAIVNEGSGVFPPPMLTLLNDVLMGNVASGGIIGNGGGFANLFGGSATLDSTTIFSNTASGLASQANSIGGTGQGGGVFNLSSTLTITDSFIALNQAIGGDGAVGGDGQGGGIYTTGGPSSPVTIAGTWIVGNAALGGHGQAKDGQGVGGGLYIASGPVTLRSGTLVIANSASTADPDIHGMPLFA